jgi:Mg-chelatase subunit ChlD
MHTTKIALFAAAALVLAACGPDEQEQKTDAAQDKLRASETVAGALANPWPAPVDEEVDYDPVRTRDNLMVALDMSGSMSYDDCAGRYPSKAAAAKDALRIWLQSVPAEANVGLAAFVNGQSKVYLPLATKNRERFIQTVNGLRPDGGTPLS